MTQDFKTWRKQRQGIPTWKTVEEAYQLGRSSRDDEVQVLEQRLGGELQRGAVGSAPRSPAPPPGERQAKALEVMRASGRPMRLFEIRDAGEFRFDQSAHETLASLIKKGLVKKVDLGLYALAEHDVSTAPVTGQMAASGVGGPPGSMQKELLRVLAETDHPLRLTELAELVKRSPNAAQHALHRLLVRGRVTRLAIGLYALPNGTKGAQKMTSDEIAQRVPIGDANPGPNPLQRGFGPALRERRLAAGLTQDELAERAGIHPMTISRLETGFQKPNISTLRALGRGLGIDLRAMV